MGYRWYERSGARPLFAFGFGKSYSEFNYSDLRLDGPGTDHEMAVRVTVTNVSDHAGRDTPQVYVAGPSHRPRLAGWAKPRLATRESKVVSIPLDLRVFANYSEALPGWVIEAGEYELTLATDARTPVDVIAVTLLEITESPGREAT